MDDDPDVRELLRDFLDDQGYETRAVDSCAAARGTTRGFRPDLVILDHELPDGNAIELLPWLREVAPEVPVMILTGHGSIDLAVRAIKEGADQFLTKPVELGALGSLVERALQRERARRRDQAGSSRQQRQLVDPFLGTSDAIRRLEEEARLLAPSDNPILVTGETGAGKGVLVTWLHQNGPRSREAFVDLNCAGLSREFLETELFGHAKGAFTGASSDKEGLFEIADRGTLFLDEIGDIDPAVQPKLLKSLEEKRFRRLGEVRDRHADVRLIAATHQDLAQRTRDGSFRQDLYYRISTLPLRVPSLRERAEDIPLLATSLLQTAARRLGRNLELNADGIRSLRSYSWPGNIRELRNVLERAALLSRSEELSSEELRFEPGAIQPGSHSSASPEPRTGTTLLEMEKLHILHTLEEENGHVANAAERLGVPRSTLYQKVKEYGLKKPSRR